MNEWLAILDHVEMSVNAEQIFCSTVTEMTFMSQFSSQQPLKTVHKENYETSYHRNTAAGNLHRLFADWQNEMLVLMTVECIAEAEKHDKVASTALRQITASDVEGEAYLTQTKYWHKKRKFHLKRAARLLHLVIGPDMWQKGLALAE